MSASAATTVASLTPPKTNFTPLHRILVLIKQVPDQNAKAGINPDGTIDRAKAKRMMNPFDRYALNGALFAKKHYGGEVVALTMGPPLAEEILLEALSHGADRCVMLSDRRLAASDTWATAYALTKLIESLGGFDMIFCGLQTTDGDTAQVGPQIAERLQLPQTTYCEDFYLDGDQIKARRVIEGGYQWVSMARPGLITVANSYHPLGAKSFRGERYVQHLARNPEAKAEVIRTVTLDDIGADPQYCGLKGSPTIVAKTDKVGVLGGSCVVQQGQSATEMVRVVIQTSALCEFLRAS